MEQKRGNALQDLHILDFSWVIAGPETTRYLAFHGATVVKIESSRRLDIFRSYIPMADGIPGVNRCGAFDAYNNDKYDMTIDLNRKRGIEVAKRLVAWADVVVENFLPGTMENWKLGYDDLKEVKADIIMVSFSMQGQTGPHSRVGGFGTELQSLAGYTNLIGWPDRAPSGSNSPYTDFIVPWIGITAIMAALDYRERTGKGQHIDIDQLEAGTSFLSYAVLDYTVNNRIAGPKGNRCDYGAPHGTYKCKGNDKWCTIAVYNDDEWAAFCNAIGNPGWTTKQRFATLLGRKRNEDELDRLIEGWTADYTPEEVMAKMQVLSVASGIVAMGEDIHKDPQLRHRSHFKVLDHVEIGEHSYETPSWRLSKTDGEIRMPSPCLGEHTEYVCREILMMSDREFIELFKVGVFE
ncbi:MAG: CoA transferase [Thermodesulfobacteriota bacterium]|nr:CoA transferase [Thermodesulfobacteriota bacterium]